MVNIFTVVGTIPGVYCQAQIVRLAGGRGQFTVLGLVILAAFFLIVIPYLSILNLMAAVEKGEDIYAFNDYCG